MSNAPKHSFPVFGITLAWVYFMASALLLFPFAAALSPEGFVRALFNLYFLSTWGLPFVVAGPINNPDSFFHVIGSPLFLFGIVIHYGIFVFLSWCFLGLRDRLRK